MDLLATIGRTAGRGGRQTFRRQHFRRMSRTGADRRSSDRHEGRLKPHTALWTGSPCLDVRLPCGGGIDLYVDVNVDRVTLQRAIALGRQRRSFSMVFDPASRSSSLRIGDKQVDAAPGEFVRRFDPKLRIVLAGRGWEIVAMSQRPRRPIANSWLRARSPRRLSSVVPLQTC